AVAWTGGKRTLEGATTNVILVIYDLGADGAEEIARHELWSKVQSLSFSPDGALLAVAAQEGSRRDLHIWEPGSLPSSLTADKVAEGDVVFTPDGQGVVYRVKAAQGYQLMWRRLDGSNRRLTSDSAWRWHPRIWEGEDGPLVVHEARTGRRLHLAVVGLADGEAPRDLLDGDGPEETLAVAKGHLLFRRANVWTLCAGESLGALVCEELALPDDVRWSGPLALGPDGQPAGIVERAAGRELLWWSGRAWEGVSRDEGVEAHTLVSAGSLLAVVWQAPGSDAAVELLRWEAGRAGIWLDPPVA
ncbi:hypothetical protein IIA16_02590, partial [bacterium]|nr:hypothetical protein [bacterium]